MSKEKIEIGDKVRWKDWGPNSIFNLPLYTVIDIKYPSKTGVDIKLEEKKDNYYWTYLYNEKIGNFEFVEEAKLVPKPPTKIETGWGFE